MRSMPTEIKKNRPDDQMTSCFLKLYTPTRVCEIIIRNWSAGQLVSPKKPDDIRHNGRNESRHSMPGNGRKESRHSMPGKRRKKSRHSIPGNGHTKKENALAKLARTGHRGEERRTPAAKVPDTGQRGEGCPDAIRTQLPRR